MDETQGVKFPIYYALLAAAAVSVAVWYFYFYTSPKKPASTTRAEKLRAIENDAKTYLANTANAPTDAEINVAEQSAIKYLNSNAVKEPPAEELNAAEKEMREYLMKEK